MEDRNKQNANDKNSVVLKLTITETSPGRFKTETKVESVKGEINDSLKNQIYYKYHVDLDEERPSK